MTRLKIVLLFISILLWRWSNIESPLPSDWQTSDTVRVTIPILDYPEQQDGRAIVRAGLWYIVVPGYTEFIPGDRVSFVGRVEVETWLGKTQRIAMREVEYTITDRRDERRLPLTEHVLTELSEIRRWATNRFGRVLPEPMASLASGILLGVRATMPRDFYDALIATGTIHVVAASGYNVTVVAGSMMGLLSRLPRFLAVVSAIVAVATYVLLAGAGTSIVRAGIMGSLTLIGLTLGRVVEARRLLFVSGMIMLVANPLLLIDIGFQLSFAATIGLLYLGPMLQILDDRLQVRAAVKQFLGDYFYPTLSATVATAPVILWHFERISWIGLGVNLLVLPVVPLVMLLSALTLLASWIAPMLYVPLWYMVSVIGWFG